MALTSAEKIAAYRARKMAKGLCIGSGCHNKARKGRVDCQDCADGNTHRRRENRKG